MINTQYKAEVMNFLLISLSCKKKRNLPIFLLPKVFLQNLGFSMRQLFQTSQTDLRVLRCPKALKIQEYHQMKKCTSLISTQRVPEQFFRNSNFQHFCRCLAWPNFEGEPIGEEIFVNSAFCYMKVRRAKSSPTQLFAKGVN